MDHTSLPPPSPSPVPSAVSLVTPAASQPSFNPGIPPLNGIAPFMFPQNAAIMGNMVNPMQNAMVPGLTQQQQLAMYMMAALPPNYQQQDFSAVLNDVISRMPSSQFNGLAMQPGSQLQQPGMINGAQAIQPMQNPPVPYPKVPSSSSEGPRKRPKKHDQFTSPSPFLGPSISRRTATSPDRGSPKPSASSKGKAKAPISSGKIFVSKGKELRFYVQIDIHHRKAVVDAIKVSDAQYLL